MNDKGIIKSYSIEQIENEQHLIINAYYMNQKVATTDAGSIDNIMEKVKLFNEEYETLQQENQLMFEIQDNYNQLQSNWNSLRELIEQRIYLIEPKGTCINFYCEYDSEDDYVQGMKEQARLNTLKFILNEMNELEGRIKNEKN